MRDRQARGKDPYRSDSDPHSSDDDDYDNDIRRPSSKMRLGGGGGGGSRLEKLDFSRVELRHRAVTFLENPELLMMYAQSKGDSVASARLHFTRMLCGYEKPEGMNE
ncbi:hypothetical protein B0T18DRAFT_449513 [Schizothecium vesticola]|uniref:Uncharacterized protein n=1 Tax=Schizothecium vesticola TaxID=314040 RepID=A0AA40EKM6_9PEZI|nr:hypothetical protein B0T18DRAFT_449513 [Schizothecium vesticola]